MRLKPYLTFNGSAEEAAEFYATVLGGTVKELHRYGDFMPDVPEEYRAKVVHLCLEFDGNTFGMADVEPGKKSDFGHWGHSLTLHCDSIEQIETLYAALSAQGSVKCPLGEACFAKRYAELTDRYGVAWALIIE